MEVLGGQKIKSPGNVMNCPEKKPGGGSFRGSQVIRGWREGGADGRGQGGKEGHERSRVTSY